MMDESGVQSTQTTPEMRAKEFCAVHSFVDSDYKPERLLTGWDDLKSQHRIKQKFLARLLLVTKLGQ
jgi:hypothetical protein